MRRESSGEFPSVIASPAGTFPANKDGGSFVLTNICNGNNSNHGDLSYWQRRAEEELALARRSSSPEAERFRYQLAGLYFDRYFSSPAR